MVHLDWFTMVHDLRPLALFTPGEFVPKGTKHRRLVPRLLWEMLEQKFEASRQGFCYHIFLCVDKILFWQAQVSSWNFRVRNRRNFDDHHVELMEKLPGKPGAEGAWLAACHKPSTRSHWHGPGVRPLGERSRLSFYWGPIFVWSFFV